jgi:hypothetical protein
VESSGKRTRGPNKQTPWSRRSSDGLSVLRLALDTHDPAQRGSIEAMFSTAFSLRRAVQRDARSSCRAYWAATHERARDPAAVRARLGLSRKAFEHAAFAHLDAAPHLRRFTTKALAMHLADSVWTGTERNLFRDARGNRHGLGRIGRYYDFARLPGRARSHTTENKWETFRLHGTLDGHRAAYSNRDGDFVQPRHLRPVHSDAWWSYEGPLVMVFSGLPGGTLVLPVRLPTAPSNQPILDHHLADPCRWHKVDLVRRRDAHAAGGWRYEAHLIVLTTPYVSPAVATRRANTAIASMDRTAGVDVNVSNVTVASHDMGRAMRVTRVERDEAQRAKDHKRSRRTRRRQRELDRSRRAANRAQYQLSKRQEKRARRRAAAGLSPVKVLPMGPRNARTDGVPLQSYKRDQLSKGVSAHACCRGGRCGRSDAGTSRSGSPDRDRPRGHAWLSARRGGRPRLDVVAIMGPRRCRVLTGHVARRDRSRGARRRGACWWRRWCDSRRHAHHGDVAALPMWCTRRQAPRRSDPSLRPLSAPWRSRCGIGGARLVCRARKTRRTRVRAGGLSAGRRSARRDPTRSFTIFGVARHPVRVNRPLRSRRIVRRGMDVHIRHRSSER